MVVFLVSAGLLIYFGLREGILEMLYAGIDCIAITAIISIIQYRRYIKAHGKPYPN